MKAVTIYQPYAELIARGEKRVENRSWRTDYRGPLAIHAGCSRAWLRSWPRPFSPGELSFGAIIAVAELTGCIHVEQLRGGLFAAQLDPAIAQHASGPWCFLLDGVRRLPRPIYCLGRQGFWRPADAVLAAIADQLGEIGAASK